MQEDSKFKELFEKNFNGKTEKKKNLTYLSWAWAWAEFVKVYPDATYEIQKDGNGMPFYFDEFGAMCYTRVTAGRLTHEMWLPIMNSANKAMKREPYTYEVMDWKTKKMVEKKVEAFTMFDVNKTIMRCLVKNLAMFGLGLYIYAGEDMPEFTPEPPKTKEDFPEITEKFNNCQTMGELQSCFMGLDVRQKQLFNDLKNEIKKKLEGDSNEDS